jgi:tRNA pseudouridine13 synthase
MPLPRVTFKATCEDFRVDELFAYEPSGVGEHVYVHFEKTDLTTDEAVRRIARATGAKMREVGVAGMKDRRGVTTQQISLFLPERQHPDLSKVEAMNVEGVRILSVKRHGNKLRTGHLLGNRFQITLRDVAPQSAGQITETLRRAGEVGVPNAYGRQRFGRDDDNDKRALAWLRGDEPAPRDPKKRRFMFSALQSRAFNQVLSARVEDGTFVTPIDGDLLCVHRSGGIFPSENLAEERTRADALEICPTGPMPGAKMKEPSGAALALEQAVIARVFGQGFEFGRTAALGEGTRRPLRMLVSEMRVAEEDVAAGEQTRVLRVYFVLPKGAYATTVLASAVEAFEPHAHDSKEESAEGAAHDEDASGNTKV